MTPDFLKVIADYLRSDSGVAQIIGRRVVTKPPDDKAPPWVQLTQIAGPQSDTPDHHIEGYFQFDCYAGFSGGLPQAFDTAKAVREAMKTINLADHNGTVVTHSNIVEFMQLADDDLTDDVGHARERFVVGATVGMHPG